MRKSQQIQSREAACRRRHRKTPQPSWPTLKPMAPNDMDWYRDLQQQVLELIRASFVIPALLAPGPELSGTIVLERMKQGGWR